MNLRTRPSKQSSRSSGHTKSKKYQFGATFNIGEKKEPSLLPNSVDTGRCLPVQVSPRSVLLFVFVLQGQGPTPPLITMYQNPFISNLMFVENTCNGFSSDRPSPKISNSETYELRNWVPAPQKNTL